MELLKRIWPSDKGDIITTKYLVHTFRLSDSDDPDIYAAQPLWEWEQSEMGKWVTSNAKDKPIWTRNVDHTTYGYIYQIHAHLTPKQITFFELKYK